MTTKLAGLNTRYLPFNQGSNGAGNVGGAVMNQNVVTMILKNGTATGIIQGNFDEILSKEDSNKDNELLYLNNNNIEYAKDILTDEGFVILKGSKIKNKIANSLSPSLIKYAQRT